MLGPWAPSTSLVRRPAPILESMLAAMPRPPFTEAAVPFATLNTPPLTEYQLDSPGWNSHPGQSYRPPPACVTEAALAQLLHHSQSSTHHRARRRSARSPSVSSPTLTNANCAPTGLARLRFHRMPVVPARLSQPPVIKVWRFVGKIQHAHRDLWLCSCRVHVERAPTPRLVGAGHAVPRRCGRSRAEVSWPGRYVPPPPASVS